MTTRAPTGSRFARPKEAVLLGEFLRMEKSLQNKNQHGRFQYQGDVYWLDSYDPSSEKIVVRDCATEQSKTFCRSRILELAQENKGGVPAAKSPETMKKRPDQKGQPSKRTGERRRENAAARERFNFEHPDQAGSPGLGKRR